MSIKSILIAILTLFICGLGYFAAFYKTTNDDLNIDNQTITFIDGGVDASLGD